MPRPPRAVGLRNHLAAAGALLLITTLAAPPAQAAPPGAGAVRAQLVADQLLAGPPDEPVEAVVVLTARPELAPHRDDPAMVAEALQQTAAASQADVVQRLAAGGADVATQLWIQNAVVVRARPAALRDITAHPGVTRVIPNFPVTIPEPAPGESQPAIVDDRTWGIDRIGAHRVWDELDVDGAGIRVAVLDTGVDPYTPDLAGRLVTDDPDDPDFPGGWIAYQGAGELFRIDPFDTDLTGNHGTHVSSTIAGGADSGIAVGVAPGVELMHAAVVPAGTGDFASVLAGMQWAMDPHDFDGQPAGAAADVVSMSLGTEGFHDEFITPVRNLVDAGIFPAVAIGNDCEQEGGTASPGNVYEAVGVGATDREDTVPDFSCGGVVNREQWESPPADWPPSYVKPDLTAPGVEVYSALAYGLYASYTGTSMATPHVAGAVALLREANPGLGVTELFNVLTGTAYFDDRHGPERPNPRYGYGRIDAFGATSGVVINSGVIGTVLDAATGQPLAGAKLAVPELGWSVTTDADGSYRLRLPPGGYAAEVRRFGYQPDAFELAVGPGTPSRFDPELRPQPGGATGTVVDDGTGMPVPHARIRVVGQPAAVVEADQDGAFTTSLPPGTHQLRAAAPPLRDSAATTVTVTGGSPVPVTLRVRSEEQTELVSVAPDGTGAEYASREPSISADGRYVAFYSHGMNLAPGIREATRQVYVRDRRTGFTELVSVTIGGRAGDDWSSDPQISADGRYVAFSSTASDLVFPSPSLTQVYLRDRVTGSTELVSVNDAGDPGDLGSWAEAVSADGRYVLFRSVARNLAPDLPSCGVACYQLYLRDRVAGTTELVSVGGDGAAADQGVGWPSTMSQDGSQVGFRSQSSNLDGSPGDGRPHVYLRDRDAGSTTLLTRRPDGTPAGNGRHYYPALSGDGRVIAWYSESSELVAGDTNDAYDVFVYDRDQAALTRVSVASDGTESNGHSLRPTLSGDGRYVAFPSLGSNLVEGDTNGVRDVFVHDRATGQTARESVGPNGQQAASFTTDPVISQDGQLVAFWGGGATSLVDRFARDWEEAVFLRDRSGGEPEPQPRFVLWDLRPEPSDFGGQVLVQVRNVGADTGTVRLELWHNETIRRSGPLTLAPGESGQLSWPVSFPPGTHHLQVGHLRETLVLPG